MVYGPFFDVNNPADLCVSMLGEQRAPAEFRRDPLGTGEELSARN